MYLIQKFNDGKWETLYTEENTEKAMLILEGLNHRYNPVVSYGYVSKQLNIETFRISYHEELTS